MRMPKIHSITDAPRTAAMRLRRENRVTGAAGKGTIIQKLLSLCSPRSGPCPGALPGRMQGHRESWTGKVQGALDRV